MRFSLKNNLGSLKMRHLTVCAYLFLFLRENVLLLKVQRRTVCWSGVLCWTGRKGCWVVVYVVARLVLR